MEKEDYGTKQLLVLVNAKDKKEFADKCFRENTKMSDVINNFIKDYIKEN